MKFLVSEIFAKGKSYLNLITTGGQSVVITNSKAITWLLHQNFPCEIIIRKDDFYADCSVLKNGLCYSNTGYRLLVLDNNLKPRPAFVGQNWGYHPDRHTVQIAYPGDFVVASAWGHGGEIDKAVFQLPKNWWMFELGHWDAAGYIPDGWDKWILSPTQSERIVNQSDVDRWVNLYIGRSSSWLELCPNCGHIPADVVPQVCDHCGFREDLKFDCPVQPYGLFHLKPNTPNPGKILKKGLPCEQSRFGFKTEPCKKECLDTSRWHLDGHVFTLI